MQIWLYSQASYLCLSESSICLSSCLGTCHLLTVLFVWLSAGLWIISLGGISIVHCMLCRRSYSWLVGKKGLTITETMMSAHSDHFRQLGLNLLTPRSLLTQTLSDEYAVFGYRWHWKRLAGIFISHDEVHYAVWCYKPLTFLVDEVFSASSMDWHWHHWHRDNIGNSSLTITPGVASSVTRTGSDSHMWDCGLLRVGHPCPHHH